MDQNLQSVLPLVDMPPLIPITPPFSPTNPVNSGKSFPWLMILLSVFSVSSLLVGIFLYIQVQTLKNQIAVLPNPTVPYITPTMAVMPPVSPTIPPTTPTPSLPGTAIANKKASTYTNDIYKFSLEYPSIYTIADTGGGAKDSYGNTVLAAFMTTDKKTFDITLDDSNFTPTNLRKYAPTGSEALDPSIVTTKFFYYGPGGGGVCYPDQYFTSISPATNGKILIFRFYGCDEDKTPSKIFKDYEMQIIKSFKILAATPTISPTTLNYSLPSGWSAVKLLNSVFSIGYEPNTMTIAQNTKDGLILKFAATKYSYADVVVIEKPYDGGSRHTFIYGTTGNVPAERLAGYHELNYLVGGKSCLFLVGIQPSQSLPTWGMCPTSAGKAVLINMLSQDDSAIVKMMKTVKLQ